MPSDGGALPGSRLVTILGKSHSPAIYINIYYIFEYAIFHTPLFLDIILYQLLTRLKNSSVLLQFHYKCERKTYLRVYIEIIVNQLKS